MPFVDRQFRRGTVPAESLEMLGAGGQRAVKIEARDRPPGAFPPVLRTGDEDDRAMEPLDKARRHDADHALVPVFVPEDVAAPAARGLRQALDQHDGLRGGYGPLRPGGPGSAPRAREPADVIPPRPLPRITRNAVSGRPSRLAALIRGAIRNPTALASTAAGLTRALFINAWYSSPRTRAHAGRRKKRGSRPRRDDVRDRGEGDEVEAPLQEGVAWPEQRFAELVDDARSAKFRKGIEDGRVATTGWSGSPSLGR